MAGSRRLRPTVATKTATESELWETLCDTDATPESWILGAELWARTWIGNSSYPGRDEGGNCSICTSCACRCAWVCWISKFHEICMRAFEPPPSHQRRSGSLQASSKVLQICTDTDERGKPAALTWRPGLCADVCMSYRGHGGHKEWYGVDKEMGGAGTVATEVEVKVRRESWSCSCSRSYHQTAVRMFSKAVFGVLEDLEGRMENGYFDVALTEICTVHSEQHRSIRCIKRHADRMQMQP